MPNLSHPLSKRPRRTFRALIVAGLASASVLSLAPVAEAGEYTVFSCRTPTGVGASAADWTAETAGNGPIGSIRCAQDGFMYATIGPFQRSTQARTGFALRMTDGLLVKRLTADRWVKLLPGADNGGTVTYELLAGDPWSYRSEHIVETCAWSAGCSGFGWDGAGGASASRIDRGFEPGVGFVGFAVACRGEAWGACGAAENGRGHLRLNAVELQIEDVSKPQIGAASGTLLQAGPRRGTESLTFGATDRGAGVYGAWLTLDGARIATIRPDDRASCSDAGVLPDSDLEFERIQPCLGSVDAVFSVDTTALPEGTHRLEAVVRDAAGNQTRGLSQDILIDNVAPPSLTAKPAITGEALATGLRPGDAIVAQNGSWNGAPSAFSQRWQRATSTGIWADIPNATGGTYRVGTDDVDHQLRVVVTARSGEGATEGISDATALVKSGKTVVVQSVKPTTPPASANGAGGNPATGQLVVDREQRTVEVKHAAKIVITGRLVDADGNPIADATVDVFEQIAVTAAAWAKVDTVKTDSQGGYVYRPKTTSSRRLRFAFTAQRDGSDYRATREVFVSVTAGMTIRARSKVVPRGGLIRLGGQVVLDRLPAKGAWVEVQVLDASVWRTVATRRVAADGRWTFKHRLRKASATRFAFRARLRTAGDIPSAEAKSTPLKVRVR